MTILVKMGFRELQLVDPQLLSHWRLLHSMVSVTSCPRNIGKDAVWAIMLAGQYLTRQYQAFQNLLPTQILIWGILGHFWHWLQLMVLSTGGFRAVCL